MMYKLNIDLSKVPKEYFKVSAKNGHTYLNLILVDKMQQDQYGNDAYVAVDMTQQQREENGNKPIYCGDGKKKEFTQNGTPPQSHLFAAQNVGNQNSQGVTSYGNGANSATFNQAGSNIPENADDLPF